MSNELDKLAAEMRKMKPSKSSRQGAMDAAMSAFSAEFSPEKSAEKTAEKTKASEKNTTATQGLADAARPTGQTTRTTRVQTFGRQTMAKFNALTNFKPQNMMMAGTCAAALIAGLIVFPVMGELSTTGDIAQVQAIESAQADSAAAESATAAAKVQPDGKVQPDESFETVTETVVVNPEPRVYEGDPSVYEALLEAAARTDAAAAPETSSPAGAPAAASPQTIVVERRVVKTPARAAERTVPAKTSTVTERVLKTPARTVERTVPAITKQETRRIEKDDGSFETVTETVVVQEASTELVSIPATYENVTVTVVSQPASSETVVIPATYEMVRETIQIEADGTQTVISSEPVRAASPPAPQAIPAPPQSPALTASVASASKVQGGITSIDGLVNNIRRSAGYVEAENRQRVQAFKASPPPAAVVSAAPPPPPPPVSAPIGAQAAVPASDANAPREIEKFAGLTLEVAPPELVSKMETIVLQPASVEYVTQPGTYETYTETIVVQEASTELVTIPAEFEWVDGEIEGNAVEYVKTPPEFETVTETVVVQPASVEYVSVPKTYETVTETLVVQPEYFAADGTLVPAITEEYSRRIVKTPASTVERSIPAVTKQINRRVVKTPGRTIERIVPFQIKDGKTRVVTKAATVQERTVPSVAKTETRQRVKTPASTVERVVPAVTKQVQVKVIAPPKYILRDDDGNIVREFENRDAFEIYKANLPTPVAEKPVSTFSVDVDTASYSFMRASINAGKLPPRESIRLEEMINYFPYDYDAPKSADEPFKANVTVTSNPWNADTKLMHVGIKGYVPPASERPRSNLVFLIDTSGSMNRANKLPLLINSFKLLLNTLDEDDTVSIVAYASASGTVLEPTRVRDKDDILKALNNLRAGGSTAGAAGLELAYQKAQENFDDEGVNRVILATDGDFNVGFSSPADMKTFIEEKRESGIFLSVLGFGMGNYKDDMMQSLAQNGNGVAAYIDSLSEAQKVLANEAGSALFTIAKDVKIQVEFNPAKIAEYRLIGYETRALKRQDFNNDKVDAGEIGAGHSVTAIYEMTPVGSPAVTMDKLRYVADTPPKDIGSDEYAFVKIRHKLPDADKSTLQTFPIGKRQERRMSRASDDMRFATAVSIVGQKLRGYTAVEDYSYADAIKLAKGAKGKDENGYRAEFIQLVKLIETMEE